MVVRDPVHPNCRTAFEGKECAHEFRFQYNASADLLNVQIDVPDWLARKLLSSRDCRPSAVGPKNGNIIPSGDKASEFTRT
jgi:hypothetical protein